jgi:hypothetical protein
VADASTGSLSAQVLQTPNPPPTPGPCFGDCDRGGSVTIDELVRAVGIALGSLSLAQCPDADVDSNAQVTIDEIIKAVNAALNGCMGPVGLPRIEFATDPFANLPVDEDGKKVVMEGRSGGDRFMIRADETLRDPITAKAACLHLVLTCLNSAPPAEESIAPCVDQTPTCATEMPWEEADCCPAACKSAFTSAIQAEGVADAFIEHLAGGKDCYPGLRAFLEGTP